jgi:4-amino-4-deoxy-L-arabinose transferase
MTAPAARPSREPWVFLAACLVVALLGQGLRPLFETDEGRYAEPARVMLETGDFLIPTLQGRPHLTKPPGTYVSVAAGLAMFGNTAFGARFLLGLAHVLSAISVRSIGRRLCGDAAGARAGWIWLGMLYPFVCGSILTTDAFHVACALAAIACGCRAHDSPRRGAWLALSGVLLGAASLYKGPLAWFPWMGFVAGWAGHLRRPGLLRAPLSVAGGVLAAVAGLGWYVWAIWIEEIPGAREQYLGTETVGRLTSSGDHEPQPFWWFVPILAAGTLPWWGALARGLRGSLADAAGRLLLVWAAVPFVIHSAVPSKNWLYVVAVCAPLAILAARGARDAASPFPFRPAALVVWLAALVGLRAAVVLVPTAKDMAALSAAVDRADPSGTLPVTFLSGRELRGLYFYRDGKVLHLTSREVSSDWADATLAGYARERLASGECWVLVTEPGEESQAALLRDVGDRAVPAAESGRVRLRWDGLVPRLVPSEAWTVYLVDPARPFRAPAPENR